MPAPNDDVLETSYARRHASTLGRPVPRARCDVQESETGNAFMPLVHHFFRIGSMQRMTNVRAIVLVLSLFAFQSARAQSAPKTAEDSVRSVVQSYLHGLKFNDVPSLKAAFWPGAKLFWAKRNGELGELSQEQWYASFEKSAGKEEQGDLRIASMDVTRDIASVKVVEDYPGSRYTDYVSLLRVNGRWMIVNKVYTAEKR